MNGTRQACRLAVGPSEPIFVIADIHSNLAALESVCAEIGNDPLVICAGDITGYYTEPNEVCERLRALSAVCIKGNHDKYVLGELDYPLAREEKYRVLPNRSALTPENRDWLAALPEIIDFDIARRLDESDGIVRMGDHVRLQLAHGTPRDIEEYVYPDTPIEFLASDMPGFLVLGHTHHPMLRHANAITVLNPGSVGQVRDRKPGASYASLMPFSGEVTFHRASYDVNAYQRRLEGVGVHSSMISILSRSLP